MNSEHVQFNPKISTAIRNRNFSALKELLSAEPEQIRAYTPFGGGTWLHYAAGEGDVDAVRLLLSLGSDVNVGDFREGRRAICDASMFGHENVVKVLLGAGSKLDTSESIRNPLFAAIIGRSVEIVKLLLDYEIDSSIRYTGESMKNMDAIAFALERGEREIAAVIARHNANDDAAKAESLLAEGMEIAKLNNQPRNTL